MSDAPSPGELGSDTAKVVETSVAEDDRQRVIHTRVSDSDWLLSELIHLANHGLEPGITLHISGTVVTGVLIGGGRWIEEFAADFEAGVANSRVADLAGEMRARFLSFKEAYSPEALEKRHEPTFIHLKDAKFLTPGSGINMTKGALWRGRLSHVSGFNLGIMQQDNP